jgi:hypothetical protein
MAWSGVWPTKTMSGTAASSPCARAWSWHSGRPRLSISTGPTPSLNTNNTVIDCLVLDTTRPGGLSRLDWPSLRRRRAAVAAAGPAIALGVEVAAHAGAVAVVEASVAGCVAVVGGATPLAESAG